METGIDAHYSVLRKELHENNDTVPISKLAPTGWHVPSDAEWTTLINYLGGITAGGEMKSIGTIEAGTGLWITPNTGATNESGFTALPSGFRFNYGTFYDLSYSDSFWSSTEASLTNAWGFYLNHDSSNMGWNNGSKLFGVSVRCLKD